jgi:hypothetical protein
VRCRREAGDGGPKRLRLLLMDTKLGTKGNDEECGKGLWGRRGCCAVPFIGSGRWGAKAVGELDSGRGVRFEVGRFEDEGDTVRHRFIGQKEGGRAALWFDSPRVEDGMASGATRRGNADWAGGGGSGIRGKETTPEVGQAEPKAKTGRKT